MTLKIITKTKSRFISYTDNVAITIGNLIVRIQFYIINIPSIKIILSFPFFQKAKFFFQYPSDKKSESILA